MDTVVPISVITLTKNRANLLEKCLNSVVPQLSKKDELIVVDNCSIDATQATLKKYKKRCTMHVYVSNESGYPNLYNFAITKCSNPIVVFIDDDCMITEGYIKNIKNKYAKRQDMVLQGRTVSLPKGNIFAEISQDHLLNWMESNLNAEGNLMTIDNRNVAIPLSILKRFGGFSPKMITGSEDIELGRRLYENGVLIEYDIHMVSYHMERTTLSAFLSQHARIAASHAVLDKTLPQGAKISLINTYTWSRHIHTCIGRMWIYVKTLRFIDALSLPCIYALLILTRMHAYVSISYTSSTRQSNLLKCL